MWPAGRNNGTRTNDSRKKNFPTAAIWPFRSAKRRELTQLKPMKLAYWLVHGLVLWPTTSVAPVVVRCRSYT
jgi:hypothetical protein